MAAEVSPHDRLSFTLFLAAALHGLLIFGVALELNKPNQSAPSVTVTLATHASKEEPDNADFVAQANQIGSGTLEENRQITTDKLSPFSSQTIENTELLNKTQASTPAPNQRTTLTSKNSDDTISTESEDWPQQEKLAGQDDETVHSLNQEIASLTAKLDKQRQQYAKRPRERVLTSVSAKASQDAAYLNEWTRKIESIGNQNFPREAIQNRVTGSLRLQSVVKWDGTLVKAEILESSGHNILDNAALQIIHRASPFLPFPPEIRKDTDQLAIIRTWHFNINGLSTSQ